MMLIEILIFKTDKKSISARQDAQVDNKCVCCLECVFPSLALSVSLPPPHMSV